MEKAAFSPFPTMFSNLLDKNAFIGASISFNFCTWLQFKHSKSCLFQMTKFQTATNLINKNHIFLLFWPNMDYFPNIFSKGFFLRVVTHERHE